MKKCSIFQLSDILFLLVLCYFGLAAPAHAYFDIGTGAFLIQMVVAFAASVWLSMKTSFIKIDRGLKPKKVSSAGGSEPIKDVDKPVIESDTSSNL